MTTTTLDVEVTPWFESKGVLTSLYIGEACQPAYEGHTPYKDLVKQNLFCYTAPVTGKIPPEHFDEVEEFVRELEKAAKYARKQMEKMKENV
jgi:ABC-type nitrate/sulfonate/bicarbonate transport system substrate-binding protein